MKSDSNKKNATKKAVIAALFAALACVATMIIKIPSPLKGYINLGDCIVLLAGWLISPVYAFISAGLGSALADVFSGYAFYAPATFFIKGLTALTALYISRLLNKKMPTAPSQIISGVLAETVMIGGYYLFEGILYGFGSALVNIPANAVQAAAGIILATALITVLKKMNIEKILK